MSEHLVLCYFVRHGNTVLNLKNCFRGPLDIPLAPEGVQDAHRLAEYFKNIDVSAIVSSARNRAMRTARIIAEPKGMEVFPNEGLFAWNVGHLAGQERTPENVAEVKYHVDNPDVPIQDGESLNAFRDRIRPLISEAVEIGMHCGVPPLIVAHSSIIHEVGEFINGSHASTLVKPGGAAAVLLQDGKLRATPIYKPDLSAMSSHRAEVIT